MTSSRRAFLRASTGGVLGAGLRGQGPDTPGRRPFRPSLPAPDNAGFDHVVVLMMENRSFDHLLGWLPNSTGKQAGLAYPDRSGVTHTTYALAPDYTGCAYRNPDHSYAGGRVQYNSGKMDGFLLDTANDAFALGYYAASDLPFVSALALNYTMLDQYFCSILGPTYPNRIFLHTGQTDRLDNSLSLCTLPTIWDSLATAGVSARYYYNNLSFLGLWGTKYVGIAHGYDQFLAAAATGDLPAVTFVDPLFTVTSGTDGNDFQPHSDVRASDAFVARTYHAIFDGPHRTNTVFVLTFDEWGGFFDHVAPPRVIAPNGVDTDLENGRALLGFRVPAIIASPFTRGLESNPRVSHLLYDHTSILKLIEWRWNLPPLTARDASYEVNNLALALDLSRPAYDVPTLPAPTSPQVQPCAS
ncbi:MAG TPA: alkaline phosphatase family protein [Bryobacteraceae bacterium]|nr:alkaline phosphatase family protein [Bryobacteraceae bacterium]